MNIVDKINLLSKNKKARDEKNKKEKLYNRYQDLKRIYDEVESSLKQGYVNIVVTGFNDRDLAKKYFSNCWIGCSGDCITNYVLEMTESGIVKLEKDYNKAKEAYKNAR